MTAVTGGKEVPWDVDLCRVTVTLGWLWGRSHVPARLLVYGRQVKVV